MTSLRLNITRDGTFELLTLLSVCFPSYNITTTAQSLKAKNHLIEVNTKQVTVTFECRQAEGIL